MKRVDQLAGDGRRTQAIYDFILDFLEENLYAPSIDEIRAGVGISSKACVWYHIKKLIEAGYLYRPRKEALVVVGSKFIRPE